MGLDGSLFATETIIPDSELLGVLRPGAHIILGTPEEALIKTAQSLGIGLREYESDKELMLMRMPAIVEGALKLAIENTDRTLHDSHICVVGYGNIGAMLTRILVLLGAHVTLAARKPVARADARNVGAQAAHGPRAVPGHVVRVVAGAVATVEGGIKAFADAAPAGEKGVRNPFLLAQDIGGDHGLIIHQTAAM